MQLNSPLFKPYNKIPLFWNLELDIPDVEFQAELDISNVMFYANFATYIYLKVFRRTRYQECRVPLKYALNLELDIINVEFQSELDISNVLFQNNSILLDRLKRELFDGIVLSIQHLNFTHILFNFMGMANMTRKSQNHTNTKSQRQNSFNSHHHSTIQGNQHGNTKEIC